MSECEAMECMCMLKLPTEKYSVKSPGGLEWGPLWYCRHGVATDRANGFDVELWDQDKHGEKSDEG